MIKQILCLMAITPLMAATPSGDPAATTPNASGTTAAPSSPTVTDVNAIAHTTAAVVSTAAALADPTQRNLAIDKIVDLGTNFLLNSKRSNQDLAGKLGISIAEFVGYKATLESLLKKKLNGTFDYNQAEAFAKKLLGVCLKAQTSKLGERLTSAGVDANTMGLFKTLGYVVTQSVAKVAATGVCGSCFASGAKSVADFFEVAVPQGQ